MKHRFVLGCAATVLMVLFNLHPAAAVAETLMDNLGGNAIHTATLEECLQTALENNHLRPASRYAVETAEALLSQLNLVVETEVLAMLEE